MPKSILRLPAVTARVGLSRSSVYLLVKQGRFPPPIKLSERASGWIEDEISAWQAERIAQSRKAAT